jgi:hypothetical protein
MTISLRHGISLRWCTAHPQLPATLPEAEEQLAKLYRYIADHASPERSHSATPVRSLTTAMGCKPFPIAARAAMRSARACASRTAGGAPSFCAVGA